MLVGPGFTPKNVISCTKIKRLYRHIYTLNPLFDFFFILDMDYLLISRPCFCRYFCLVNITDVRISRKNFFDIDLQGLLYYGWDTEEKPYISRRNLL